MPISEITTSNWRSRAALGAAEAEAAVTTEYPACVSTTASISVTSATSSTTNADRLSRGSLFNTSASGARSPELLDRSLRNWLRQRSGGLEPVRTHDE